MKPLFLALKVQLHDYEKLPPLITQIEPFKLSGLGYFKANKILYAKSETSELDTINASIANAFSLSQIKPFIPNATLMRVKTVEDKIAFEKILSEYENKEIETADTTFQLMQSHIKHPGGATYECAKRFELA